MAKIAVLGYGTVGSGVVEVLETNKNSIEKRAGEGIEVKYVLDLRDFPGDPVQEKIVHDVDIIIQDKEIDVVVEVMGNHADNLAIYSAIACGSEIVITDKTEYDENKIIEELKICEEEYHKKHAIIIVSEKILDVEKLANRISEETGYSGRSIVLGHIQRGGSPVPEDRILASKMAEEAICLLEKRKSGLCICMKDNQIISKNIEEALIEKNENQDRLYQLFLDLA